MVRSTFATFVPPSRIAVLRIDCDWYASTMTCLRALFPHLAEDGILIADGYPDWDGYARAIHEYLAAYEGMARIKQFDGRLYYVVKGTRNWDDAASTRARRTDWFSHKNSYAFMKRPPWSSREIAVQVDIKLTARRVTMAGPMVKEQGRRRSEQSRSRHI